MVNAGEARAAASEYYVGTPIDTLVKDDITTFVLLVDEWIDPDERVIVNAIAND